MVTPRAGVIAGFPVRAQTFSGRLPGDVTMMRIVGEVSASIGLPAVQIVETVIRQHAARLERHLRDFHRSAALGADGSRRFTLRRLRRVATGEPIGPAQEQPDEPFDLVEADLEVRTHPAVIADLLQTTRQGVLQEPADELLAGNLPCLVPLRAGWLVAVRHRRLVAGNDPMIADRRAVDVEHSNGVPRSVKIFTEFD